jgi:predicted HicB family RNase H-like nuclease
MNENAKYYDEKSKARTMKYQQTHCDRITTWVKKGDKDRYKQLADRRGKSLNALIVELLDREDAEDRR